MPLKHHETKVSLNKMLKMKKKCIFFLHSLFFIKKVCMFTSC